VTDRSPTALGALLASSHLASPDDIAGLLVDHAKNLDASDVTLYLADYEQRALVPVPHPSGGVREELLIDATLAGRCFRTLDVQEVDAGRERRLWVPVLDGTERLGVLELVFGAEGGGDVREEVVHFAGLVAELVMTKRAYGDVFEQVRRRQPMSLAAELAWQLLPPLTFGSERVIITAAVTPAYDLGGDAFDYAVDARTARFAVFDAMGHGLSAGLMATVAIAAYRNSRRQGLDLESTASGIDHAIATHIGNTNYVTGVLAEVDLASGRLRWFTAGHPRPLIIRQGRIVKRLDEAAGIPLGLGTKPSVGEAALEPDDRVLLYTDGIVEARSATGELFGLERFADVISRASSEGTLPPETVRRLMHTVLDHQFGTLRDDATVLIVQWPGHDVERLRISSGASLIRESSSRS